jgi:hypothetical protein
MAQDCDDSVVKNNNAGLADAVSGDWATTNFNGGGVGVEAFRVWMSGGPSTGITFYCDEELTRVVGSNYELITLAEEYEDRVMGRSLVSVKRRVDFPADALLDKPPTLLETSGQVFGGKSSFISYRPDDNVALNGEGDGSTADEKQRIALLHEYRGVDGSYVLTSASSITLQKWAGVLTPIEVVNRPEKTDVSHFPGVAPSAQRSAGVDFPEPARVVPARAVITGEEDVALLDGSTIVTRSRDAADPLTGVANAASVVAALLGKQAGGAFFQTSMWKLLLNPSQLPKHMLVDGDESNVRDISEVNSDPSAWKRVPKFFAINLNSYGSAKRYYLGRAIISITDEGGITFEDAWGSQILMAGGNIYLSAEHSIIRNAGTDNVDISGRDHSVLASRNMEVLADKGRATLGCATQLTLVGGQSGTGGIMIHSRGKGSGMLAQGGDAGPAYSGGLVMRSEGAVHVVGAAGVDVASVEGSVAVKSPQGMLVWSGELTSAFTPTGLWLSATNAANTALVLSPHGSAMPLLHVTQNLITYGFANTLTNDSAYYAYAGCPINSLRDAAYTYNGTSPSSPSRTAAPRPGYLTSDDYGVAAFRFSVPMAPWQTRLLTANSGNQMQLRCAWEVSGINNSQPSPGAEYWSYYGLKVAMPLYTKYTDNYTTYSELPPLQDGALSSMMRGI